MQQASITQVLLSMVYNKHYPLASAAGRFLYEFIKDDDIQNVIRAIIKFSRVPNVRIEMIMTPSSMYLRLILYSSI